jgi:hypothetical protein
MDFVVPTLWASGTGAKPKPPSRRPNAFLQKEAKRYQAALWSGLIFFDS